MRFRVIFPFKIGCPDCNGHTDILVGEIIPAERIKRPDDRKYLIDHQFVEVIDDDDTVVDIRTAKKRVKQRA
jgi:hypothetical protein